MNCDESSDSPRTLSVKLFSFLVGKTGRLAAREWELL